jgi:hypothetical protein
VKIRNSRSPSSFYVVCAGIAPIGTSASVWYLVNHWKELYKEFKNKEFGILIEVIKDQEHLAKRVYPTNHQ